MAVGDARRGAPRRSARPTSCTSAAQFPRTESGRSYVVSAADGTPLANAVRASRKDLRDAVRAARGAFAAGPTRTAMNRGQVLYRVAELMEGRRDQFVAEVAAAEGVRAAEARERRRPVDRPLGLVRGLGGQDRPGARARRTRSARRTSTSRSPSRPASSGIVAPEPSSLLGLVSRLAPPLVGGNVAVVLASETRPLPAITLTEVLATSDVPGGVVNILTGTQASSCRCSRRTWTSTPSTSGACRTTCAPTAELAAADSVKRIARRPRGVTRRPLRLARRPRRERPEWIAAFLEMKTVWHPIGV